MPNPGTDDNPLRVAIIGSGPAGFYVVERLFKETGLNVEIDMFDELATPFGLVRGGVAPDHQKIKSVIRVYDRNARKPNFRFYGNVRYGRDLHLDDLRAHYHQICFTTGAQTDRSLGIPGEDLQGSHAATEFVAWYNGHPDYRDRLFDLGGESAAVIGVGNVAIDVARILCRSYEELAVTDIADYALEALRESRIRNVHLIGRRGPAQAAFTNPEIKEMGELADADVEILPEEARLDDLSQAYVDEHADKALVRKIEILQSYAGRPATGKSRRLSIRFLLSPTEIIGNGDGRVSSLRLVKNELYADNGGLRPRATDEHETIPADIVFRSVGYLGVALPEIPFDDRQGVIPNDRGRVLAGNGRKPVPGLYASGWIKRGPTGVIGTNKPDAVETVERMLEDLEAGAILDPDRPGVAEAERLVRERQPDYVSYEDWLRLDDIETSRGKKSGRPRVKLTRTEDMIAALKA
ncbi:MAG: FAD-dependent oxidoreductase [Deltaproteobacteria bacterium]|nr:FAD-dependent oxidoreductase [Deltaproteobacteria bacterium]